MKRDKFVSPITRRQILLSPVAALPVAPALQQIISAAQSVSTFEAVRLREFGAKLDGLSDDSDALQKAVDACLYGTPVRPLLVEGPCRVGRSILINRPVDQTRGVFRIIGQGSYGGFLVAGNFPLFDSNLSNISAPLSEYLWFQNIRFEALANAPNATTLSDAFLRVQFHHCEFEQIKALAGKKYAQEWKFSHCIVRRWPGAFFSSYGGYHITSTSTKYQNGGGNVFELADPKLRDAGCVGCAFHQDIVEASNGSFLKAAVVRGLSIAGLYSEGNYGPTLDLDNAAVNRGVSVTGAMFAPQEQRKADSDFFDIRWGRIEGGHAGGNFSSGRLHHHRSTSPSSLIVSGDYAALDLIRHET